MNKNNNDLRREFDQLKNKKMNLMYQNDLEFSKSRVLQITYISKRMKEIKSIMKSRKNLTNLTKIKEINQNEQ